MRGTLLERRPEARDIPGKLPIPGPLKTDRFLLAKTGRAGDPGITPGNADLASEKTGSVPSAEGGGRRDTRILDGKEPAVGVEGRTLTEECGDRAIRDPEAEESPDGEATESPEALDALE